MNTQLMLVNVKNRMKLIVYRVRRVLGLEKSLIYCPDGKNRKIDARYLDLVRCYIEGYDFAKINLISLEDRKTWDSQLQFYDNEYKIMVNTRYPSKEVLNKHEEISIKVIEEALQIYQDIEGKKWKE